MYLVDFTKEALEDLEKLDIFLRRKVLEKIKWFRKNFNRLIPLPLSGKWRGFFKFRVGD